ncbi:MAG: alpha/beta hydrolase [Anaerolineae bacterium]|jgi:pimeloyl-ACP methyl ester carboxylesterase|nr:alpha/beta hydrolase [Anaerolineae bacterium]MBT7075426.1 alpha/beta hydrolase [Anaerolineae bacterium]MBT7782929.1 alpha/beta hydrolase [Anaerolineae bacterium]
MPFPYIHETQKITPSFRKERGGSFIALSNGYTHYELFGDENAETVVLVHGFTVPNFIWEPTFNILTKAGYRVLRYDLFGRGYSDRPKADYTLNFFANQLHDLLNSLNITKPINLFGLSMGGPITATFTVLYPESVKKLALFAPVGVDALHSSVLKLLKLPLVGELLMGLFGAKKLVDGIGKDFYDPKLIANFTEKYKTQLKISGFGRAILSTIRNDALSENRAIYERVTKTNIPLLLIWGEQDKTVPYVQSSQMQASLKRAHFFPIPNSGHIPHYENAAEVNSIILNFLQNINEL